MGCWSSYNMKKYFYFNIYFILFCVLYALSFMYRQGTEADRGHFTVKLLCFFTLLQNFHFCKIFTSTKFSLLQNFHFYVFSHFCKIFTSAKFSLLQNFHFYVFSHFCKIFTSAKFSLLRFIVLLTFLHF